MESLDPPIDELSNTKPSSSHVPASDSTTAIDDIPASNTTKAGNDENGAPSTLSAPPIDELSNTKPPPDLPTPVTTATKNDENGAPSTLSGSVYELVKSLKSIEALIRETSTSKIETPQLHAITPSLQLDELEDVKEKMKKFEYARLQFEGFSKMHSQPQELSLNNVQMQEVLQKIREIFQSCKIQSDVKVVIDKSEVQGLKQRVTDLEKLVAKISETQAKEKGQTSTLQKELELKDSEIEVLKGEIEMKNRFGNIVDRFLSSLPNLVGFLGLLFAITLPCHTFPTLLYVIVSCIGVLALGGLAIYNIWDVYIDFQKLKLFFTKNKSREPEHKRTGSSLLPSSSSDPTQPSLNPNESQSSSNLTGSPQSPTQAPQVSSWWHYAWHPITIILLLTICSLVFNVIFGIYIYNKQCEKPHPPSTSPSSPPTTLYGSNVADDLIELSYFAAT